MHIFKYESFNITDDGFSFLFTLEEPSGEVHTFTPSWHFNRSLSGIPQEMLRRMVFNIGMSELPSYWKCTCAPVIKVECGSLDAYEVHFWKKLYYHGLSEFFYRNSKQAGGGVAHALNFDDFVQLDHTAINTPYRQLWRCGAMAGALPMPALIPIGGGKDSVVTLERHKSENNFVYMINPNERQLGCAELAGYDTPRQIHARRKLDPHLLELNKRGYLNGHTPLSAVIAFSSFLAAVCVGAGEILLSNESSADESYVSGTDINHQYSKSSMFERDFQDYIAHGFGSDAPKYYSCLREFNELQITEMFVRYPQYFDVFLSCNLGSKRSPPAWCCDCGKCLYIYIMLAAFLPDERIVGFMGKNMLGDMKYRDMLYGLINPAYDKPFECVGTREEVRQALDMAAALRREELPVLIEEYLRVK